MPLPVALLVTCVIMLALAYAIEWLVLRPLVTEKGTHVSTGHNAYAFQVNTLATKDDIRKAVESLWNVRVVDVRTQNRVGKPRRLRPPRTQLVHK